MRAVRETLLFALTLSLAACDNTPNRAFEQTEKDRRTAAAGDPYAGLENALPRERYYIYQPEEARQEYADGQSGTFRATYDALLRTVEGDKKVDVKLPLFAKCRSAFEAASAYQSGSGRDAAAARAARARAVDGLQQCRAEAQDAKQAGGIAGNTGAVLSRFASAGIAMIGAKAVGQGDKDAGLKIWRQGEELASRDRPGFRLDAKAFAPQGGMVMYHSN